MVKLVSRLDQDIHFENGDEAKQKQLSEILSDYSREESDVGEWGYPDM